MSRNGPVRIGIIGAARVATYALIAPAREVERASLIAIAARDPQRARAYASEHGIQRVHENYDALIADPEIELVYVATPPALHARIAIAAIAGGKHVLVEKPFAMSSAEAEAVARAGEAAGVCVFEAMHSRHHPLFARVRDIVESGRLGRVVRATAIFDAPIPRLATEFRWSLELGGGALMDLGVYPLAWLRGLFGDTFSVANARAVIENSVDAEIEADLIFPGAIAARVHASMTAARFAATLSVEGEKGTCSITNPLVPQLGHALALTIDGATTTESVEGPSTFVAQLDAVCRSIRDHVEFPLPPRDYVRSMMAIESLRRTAAIQFPQA